MSKYFWAVLGIVILGGGIIWMRTISLKKESPSQTNTSKSSTNPQNSKPSDSSEDEKITEPQTYARGLEVPWGLAFLPDGSLIFTERPGRVRLISPKGELRAEPIAKIEEVVNRSESGLLGVAVHPDFDKNHFIYSYFTYKDDNNLVNKVVRYELLENSLKNPKKIIEFIPGGTNHDGGRLKFGPDGKLYVGTGDSGSSEISQDLNSLGGKILRLNDDGSIPTDNPTGGSAVYSYGHRNVQGLAFNAKGELWETEHGNSATDEVNIIKPGKNYGWPVIRGDQARDGMELPVIHSGLDTWAPSGAVFVGEKLFFVGLRGNALYELDTPTNVLTTHYKGKYGRLREAILGPDGNLYFATNNRDGRGSPGPEDDRILRVNANSVN